MHNKQSGTKLSAPLTQRDPPKGKIVINTYIVKLVTTEWMQVTVDWQHTLLSITMYVIVMVFEIWYVCFDFME